VKIDGVLGFPLFRNTLLTLDYPRSRVLLQPASAAARSPANSIAFNNDRKTPIIPVTIGDARFFALIDSGSDETLSLNPLGISPKYAFGPVQGPTVATLSGDKVEKVARLEATLRIGDYAVPRPVVEITDELSAIGGGILRYFTVTFDQEDNQVTFYRADTAPIAIPGRRGCGLSFTKTPAYWKVAGVIPGSPGAAAGVEAGDLVARIDGEPVAKWDPARFERLSSNAGDAVFTFIDGTRETDKRIRMADLVP
jgi:membrane-associated protease RseP (regulator of RpoE activity)